MMPEDSFLHTSMRGCLQTWFSLTNSITESSISTQIDRNTFQIYFLHYHIFLYLSEYSDYKKEIILIKGLIN